jgi:formate--tetrahydrofolate ligase
VAKADLGAADVEAVKKGAANLQRHVSNLRQFGLNPVIAINNFPADTEDEVKAVHGVCEDLGVKAVLARHWAEGGAGATDLASAVMESLETNEQDIKLLYPDEMPLVDKVRTVAQKFYGAADIALDGKAARSFKEYEAMGFGNLPICIAKTQYSFSSDPKSLGAPEGHVLPVREARLSAGAGFVVAVCGDIMTMPGLPRAPAALNIHLDTDGEIVGLS